MVESLRVKECVELAKLYNYAGPRLGVIGTGCDMSYDLVR